MDDTTDPAARRGPRSLLLCASVLAAVALVSAGCGSGNSGGETAAMSAGGADNMAPSAEKQAADTGMAQNAGSGSGSEVQHRAVISTGQVELESDDVAATRSPMRTPRPTTMVS
jgi:hypothetical protein